MAHTSGERIGRTRRPMTLIAETAIAQLMDPVRASHRDGGWASATVRYSDRDRPDGTVSVSSDFTGGHSLSLASVTVGATETVLGLVLGGSDPRGHDTLRCSVHVRQLNGSSVIRVDDVRRRWDRVDGLDPLSRRRVDAYVGRLLAASAAVAGTDPSGWNLARLRDPAGHYMAERELRTGKVELVVDHAALARDWPLSGWNRNGEHRARVARVAPDGHVAIYNDRDARTERWTHLSGSTLPTVIRQQMLNRVVELLPPEIRELAERVHPSIVVSNLLAADLGIRQLVDTAPMVAQRLIDQALAGTLARAPRSDSRQARSLARIPEMVTHPLRELATAATVSRSRYGVRGEEWAPASPALVAYVRHPLSDLSDAPHPDARQLLSSGVLEFLEHANVDRVRDLRDPTAWNLVRVAAASSARLADAVLEHPDAAANAIAGYFPEHIRDLYEDSGESTVRAVMGQVEDYLSHLAELEAQSQREPEHGSAQQQRSEQEQEPSRPLPSFRRLVVASKLWHRELRQAELDQMAVDDPDHVVQQFAPSKLDGLEAGRYRLRQLTTSRALISEGQRMGHCVGGSNYIRKCVNGESLIFSVEVRAADGVWEGVATMELGNTYGIRQIYGRRDHPIRQDAKAELQAAITAHAPRKPYVPFSEWQASRTRRQRGAGEARQVA